MGSLVLDALSHGTGRGCEALIYESFIVCAYGQSFAGRHSIGVHVGWIMGASFSPW